MNFKGELGKRTDRGNEGEEAAIFWHLKTVSLAVFVGSTHNSNYG